MDLNSFLRMLHGVSGPNASGNYEARCPAHDDHTASLSICVKQAERGLYKGLDLIFAHCHAGCTGEAVCQALGIDTLALCVDEAAGRQRREEAARAKAGKGGKVAKSPASPPPPPDKRVPAAKKANLGKPETVYPYLDEEGKLLLEVCRYKTETGKTFRQRVPDPASKSGYTWSAQGVRKVLYRLPQVVAGIKEGKPIWVVEGEKDADNLAALGYVTTTNLGGASKEGCPKWTEENYQTLAGAEVIILPDVDEVGTSDRRHVANRLLGIAKSVKLLNLDRVSSTLPEKGDVSDLIQQLGPEDAKKALDELAHGTPHFVKDDREQISDIYGDVPGYCVKDGCICQWNEESPKRLCNFVAVPRKIFTKDDGVTQLKEFLIGGWTQSGRPLPEISVPAAKFPTMSWVLESWDFMANIMPGTTVKDKLRYVITSVGDETAVRETIYQHTGWRRIGGQWAYLYQGGAIGMEGISVDLSVGLNRYSLGITQEEVAAIPEAEAAEACLMLKLCMAPHLAVPLMAMMYLAPLREFLEDSGMAPAFSLFLLGSTGTRKSTAASLMLSHFGNFTSRSLPASFGDTANNVRYKAFLLKDMPIVVDDYHPVTSTQERRKMDAIAQNLSRAFGDGAERGRLKSDRTLEESRPPRGVAILTGEDMPGVGESGAARYYVVNVSEGDVPVNEELTYMQEQAAKGVLRRAMQGYIGWLLPQADELGGRLHRRFIALRTKALDTGGEQHKRTPEAVAHMMLGYEMMMDYFVATGALTREAADMDIAKAWQIILAHADKQTKEMSDERPSRMFLSAVSELLTSKQAAVRELGEIPDEAPLRGMIGYCDKDYYYLLPESSYTLVARMYQEQGGAFPLTRRILYRQMREDGYLISDERTQKNTRIKTVDGKAQRLLWIPRYLLEGRSREEQMRLDQLMPQGFTPVNDGF